MGKNACLSRCFQQYPIRVYGKHPPLSPRPLVLFGMRLRLPSGRGRRPRPCPPPRSGLRCWRVFGCHRLRFFAGCPTPPPKADLFRQTRSALRIAGCGHWMLTGEVPPSTILVDAQSMTGREMAFEHLAAPPAFEADDIIAMNGLPDRDGGCPLHLRFGCRFTEADECLMNG